MTGGCHSTPPAPTGADAVVLPDGDDTRDGAADGALDVAPPLAGEPATFVALEVAKMPPRWDLARATGRRWHVAKSGRPDGDGSEGAPLDRIATALAKAQPGDVVLVHAGEYAEWDDDSGHGFALRTPDVAVAGAPGEAVTIVPGAGSFGYGPQLAASGTVLANLTIRGFGAVGVELGGRGAVSNLVVQDVTVDVPGEGIVSYEDLGGVAPVIRGLRLDNVTVTGPALLGISCNVGPCVDVRFARVAVHMRDLGEGSSGADAVAFERGDNLWLDAVEADHASADGLDLKAERVLVSNAYVHHVRRNGLKLWHGGDVQNTIVSHTGADAGVVFDGPGRYRLLHSVVAHHLEGRPGAYTMTVAYDVSCGGGGEPANFCCRADTGDATGLGPRCDTLELDIVNSVFSANSGPISVPTLSGVRLRHSALAGFSEEDAVLERRDTGERLGVDALMQSGVGDSLLKDAAVVDDEAFVPSPGSALIDAGVVAEPMPSSDFAGLPRVVGRAPDIGAHEVQR